MCSVFQNKSFPCIFFSFASFLLSFFLFFFLSFLLSCFLSLFLSFFLTFFLSFYLPLFLAFFFSFSLFSTFYYPRQATISFSFSFLFFSFYCAPLFESLLCGRSNTHEVGRGKNHFKPIVIIQFSCHATPFSWPLGAC